MFGGLLLLLSVMLMVQLLLSIFRPPPPEAVVNTEGRYVLIPFTYKGFRHQVVVPYDMNLTRPLIWHKIAKESKLHEGLILTTMPGIPVLYREE